MSKAPNLQKSRAIKALGFLLGSAAAWDRKSGTTIERQFFSRKLAVKIDDLVPSFIRAARLHHADRGDRPGFN
jgi:hypothetical protein